MCADASVQVLDICIMHTHMSPNNKYTQIKLHVHAPVNTCGHKSMHSVSQMSG